MAETIWWCEFHRAGGDWTWRPGLDCWGAGLGGQDDCDMVERVLSVPGELVDPADLDYEAAARRLEQKQTVARGRFRLDEADAADIVDAALGVGETAEGSKR